MALISSLQLLLFISEITTIEFEMEIEKLGSKEILEFITTNP
jgi:hypothetical protein